MNIAEILKDCPKGLKLYSSLFGEVKLCEIKLNETYPIKVYVNDHINNNINIESFTKDGRIFNRFDDADCVLFPSKDNRDWSTFKAPKKEYEFKPFDRILVRDNDDEFWCAALFSHKEENQIFTTNLVTWRCCIPYKGNEHLLGTTNPV